MCTVYCVCKLYNTMYNTVLYKAGGRHADKVPYPLDFQKMRKGKEKVRIKRKEKINFLLKEFSRGTNTLFGNTNFQQ